MDQEILDKYATKFLDGIQLKLSNYYVEGRIIYMSDDESNQLKEIMKEWLTEFYNELNG